MHWWKDTSWMLLSYVVTDILMTSTSSKRVPLLWWSSHDLSAWTLCIFIDWLSGRLARNHSWWCFSHRRTWCLLTLSCFLRTRRRQRPPLTALAIGFRVVLKNSCLITIDDSTKQIWFSLKTVDHVMTHLHAALFLILIHQTWHHFDFLHAQIFEIIQMLSFFMPSWPAIK